MTLETTLNYSPHHPLATAAATSDEKSGENLTWCIAHTQPSREEVAKRHLLDQGYGVYLPYFRKICRHARKVEEKLVPLFPRYIFVSMDLNVAPWRSIHSTQGVSYLLMSNAFTPAKVPAHIMEDLRAREIADSIVPVTSLSSFVKGEKVRILEGTLVDQTAIFQSMDDKSRVQLLLNLMGREMEVTVPLHTVGTL